MAEELIGKFKGNKWDFDFKIVTKIDWYVQQGEFMWGKIRVMCVAYLNVLTVTMVQTYFKQNWEFTWGKCSYTTQKCIQPRSAMQTY